MTLKPPSDPIATLTPVATARRGRKAITPEWTDAEAEHAAERFIALDPPFFVTDMLALLHDYLVLTEERLYGLMTAPGGQWTTQAWTSSYTTCTGKLSHFAQAGLVALAPRQVSLEMERSGYAPLRPNNPRYSRVWTLGPVGKAVARRMWGASFVPEGNEIHNAHHALAAEVQFRFAEAAREFRQKNYRPGGPRQCVVWDSEKKYAALAPDGMLKEKLPAGADKDRAPLVWAVEYHNEDRTGRAKEKIEAYLRLMGKPDLWQTAWGIEQYPKVLVVYRHEEIMRDWVRQVKALAGPRRDMFAMVSLADVMAGGDKPVKLRAVTSNG